MRSALAIVTCAGTGCFTYDTTPPVLVSSPFDQDALWLHDRLWFEFDDDIDFPSWEEHARIELADGSRLSARYWAMADDPSRVAIELDRSVVAGGSLYVQLDGVLDTADNPLEPMTLEWVLGEWTIDDAGLDLGDAAGPPVVEVMMDPWGDASPLVVATWTVGEPEARRMTGVRRRESWFDLGEHEGWRAVGIDAASLYDDLIVIADDGEAAIWSISWDPEGDFRSFDAIAASPLRRQAAVASRWDGLSVELHGSWNDEPVVLPGVAPGLSVAHVDVALPVDDEPVVAFVDRGAVDDTLMVAGYADGAWQEWASRLAPETESMSVVANLDAAYIVWTDETGSHLAAGSPGALEDLPLPVAGTVPQLGIDGDGGVIATWVENATTGRIARWDGAAWQEFAAPWIDDVTGVELSSVVMWDGRSPVVAWRENGQVRIALYNGPVEP